MIEPIQFNSMMQTVIVLLVFLVLLAALSFLAQAGVFLWLFFKGLASSTIYEVTKRKNSTTESPTKTAEIERSEIGKIVDDTRRPEKK